MCRYSASMSHACVHISCTHQTMGNILATVEQSHKKCLFCMFPQAVAEEYNQLKDLKQVRRRLIKTNLIHHQPLYLKKYWTSLSIELHSCTQCFVLWNDSFAVPALQTSDYRSKKKQCRRLRHKLFHIKRMVKDYDRNHSWTHWVLTLHFVVDQASQDTLRNTAKILRDQSYLYRNISHCKHTGNTLCANINKLISFTQNN